MKFSRALISSRVWYLDSPFLFDPSFILDSLLASLSSCVLIFQLKTERERKKDRQTGHTDWLKSVSQKIKKYNNKRENLWAVNSISSCQPWRKRQLRWKRIKRRIKRIKRIKRKDRSGNSRLVEVRKVTILLKSGFLCHRNKCHPTFRENWGFQKIANFFFWNGTFRQ